MNRKLLLIPEITGGGIGTYYKEQIDAGRFDPNQWDIYCIGKKPDHVQLSSQIKFIQYSESKYASFFSGWKTFPVIYHLLCQTFSIYSQLENQHYDHVETTDFKWLFLPWVISDQNMFVRITLHGSDGQLEWHEERTNMEYQTRILLQIESMMISAADDKIALSQTNAKWWESLGIKGIRTILPYFQPPVSQIGESVSNSEVLIIGRVQKWKGAETVARLVSRYSDLPKITWIGGDNYYLNYSISMIEYLKKTYALTDNTRMEFDGILSRHQVLEKLKSATVILVASDWDTFNLTVIEAMAMGKIVIVSEGAGASEVIHHGVNGFRFRPGEITELYSILKTVFALNPTERALIEQAAKTTFNTVFTNKLLLARMDEPISQTPRNHQFLFNFVKLDSNQNPLSGILNTVKLSTLLKYILERVKLRIKSLVQT